MYPLVGDWNGLEDYPKESCRRRKQTDSLNSKLLVDFIKLLVEIDGEFAKPRL